MGETKRAIEQSFQAWNAHNKAGWTALVNDDADIVGVAGFSGKGRELRDTFFAMWNDAFPDNKITMTSIVEDGENAAVEAMFEGTHTGPLNAPSGVIPATRKHVKAPFMAFNKVRDGKITQFHVMFDQVELLTQLGLMPVPAART